MTETALRDYCRLFSVSLGFVGENMIYVILALFILGADIATKILAKTYLSGAPSIPLIDDVFHLTYVENRGAAFGILQDGRIFFIIIAVVMAVVIIGVLRKYKNRSAMLNLGLSFLCAGALGNTIDRVMQGYVVDFFDFRLINFPVFNIADIFVCLGAALLAMFFVFFEDKNRKIEEDEKNED